MAARGHHLVRVARVLGGFVLVVALLVALCMSGLVFYCWPTFIGDHQLKVTPDVLVNLRNLQREKKFVADMRTFYPGAPNEKARQAAQDSVDAVIASLIDELPRHPRRAVVLRIFKSSMAQFDTSESEECEHLLMYFERIMNIVGINDSGELFNVWRYGLPYGWFMPG